MHAGADKRLFENARRMRSQPTDAEYVLWNYLKQKPFGFKFRRQHPYGIYILDFYCHQLKLVIEVDGSIHDLEEQKVADAERQTALEKEGLTVLRFTNDDVLHHVENVLENLQLYLEQPK